MARREFGANPETKVEGEFLARVVVGLESFGDWTEIPIGKPCLLNCPVCNLRMPLGKSRAKKKLEKHLLGHGFTKLDAANFCSENNLGPTYRKWSKSLAGSEGCRREDWFPCPLCDGYFVNGLLGHLAKQHACGDPGKVRKEAKEYGE